MGSSTNHFAIVACLLGDTLHHSDEVVERVLAFGLGGFDHQCLVEEQWEIDRRRMETIVEQALGNIESSYMK